MNEKKAKIRLPLFGIPRLFPFLIPYRRTIGFMASLGFLSSLIDAVYPLFNRYALDHFVAERTLAGMGAFVGIYLAVLAVQVVINYRSLLDAGRIEMFIDRDLRNAAFDHLQTLSFSYFNQNSVGYVHARVISDTGKIGEAVSWRMMDCVWSGSYILCSVALMLLVDAKLASIVLCLLVVAAFVISLFEGRLVRLTRKIREINAKITGDFNEGITGIKTIRILGIERHMQRDFEEDTHMFLRESVRAVRSSALFISMLALLSSTALSLVLMQGGKLSGEGVMRIGTLSVFMTYALEMVDPLQNLIQNIAVFIRIQVNIERFTKLLSENPDVADSPEVIEKYGDTFHPKRENFEELTGDIEFRDVTFRYPDGEENVLEHFNLKVPHGMNVAIVGETGAGKSTLVNLVCRFYEPVEGQLLIDGRDARERSQLWLHSHLGYVLQTPHLFSGSIRDNLLYGRPDASDGDILRAIRLVSADKIPARMSGRDPDRGPLSDGDILAGLEADVGEGGNRLSTGEKQLLSFARALLADPKLLILDEATSSIDTLTEKEIQNAIRIVTHGRTSFVIAHRLSTIVGADLILFVRDGKIIERGTHAELMAMGGEYRKLYMSQFRIE